MRELGNNLSSKIKNNNQCIFKIFSIKVNSFLITIIFLTLTSLQSAAQDSFLSSGNILVLGENDLQTISENLYISPDRVNVEYTFLNYSTQKKRVIFAFPVIDSWGFDIHKNDVFERLRPEIFVDGKRITFEYIELTNSIESLGTTYGTVSQPDPEKIDCAKLWLARNKIYFNEKYCFNSIEAQITFNQSDCDINSFILPEKMKIIETILSKEKELYCNYYLKDFALIDKNVLNIEKITSNTSLVVLAWQQEVLANQHTKIVYKYSPDLGSDIPRFSLYWLLEALNGRDALPFDLVQVDDGDYDSYCVFKDDALRVLRKMEESDHWLDENYKPLVQNFFKYIANFEQNFVFPIESFRLVISNTWNALVVLDSCFPGLKRVNHNYLVFEKSNYVFDGNVSVTFHTNR